MSIASDLIDIREKLMKLNEHLAGSKYVGLLIWIVGICGVLMSHPVAAVDVVKSSAEMLLFVVPMTIALYRLGSFWDDWLFDPIFKPETDELIPLARPYNARGPGAGSLVSGDRVTHEDRGRQTEN